jgi:5'-nucleotidase
MKPPTILITNDDGYFAEGLLHLRQALTPLGRVITVAPHEDCSGASHKISVHTPLRLREVEEDTYTINGTPADCIHIAIHGLLDGIPPDLIVSGINHGPNLGEDTTYSGTVAAAYEGFIQGIPALAVSAGRNREGVYPFDRCRHLIHNIAGSLLNGNKILRDSLWNINVPPHDEIKGLEVVRLDKRSFQSSIVERMDPRGKPYFWMGPYYPKFDKARETDYAAFRAGYITMTPLKVEMTHFDVLNQYPAANPLADLLKEADS